jgi:hypothetical protein
MPLGLLRDRPTVERPFKAVMLGEPDCKTSRELCNAAPSRSLVMQAKIPRFAALLMKASSSTLRMAITGHAASVTILPITDGGEDFAFGRGSVEDARTGTSVCCLSTGLPTAGDSRWTARRPLGWRLITPQAKDRTDSRARLNAPRPGYPGSWIEA